MDEEKKPVEPTKIWVEVLDKARQVARSKKKLLQDYLSELLDPLVERDFAEYIATEAAKRKPPEPHKKK